MQTECPFCHTGFDIDQEKIGEKWQCPKCGKELLIEEEIIVEEDAGEGVVTECPACNRRFDVGVKDIGQATVCPFCKNDFTIFPVEEEKDDSEAAGKGFITTCPNCRNHFEVGEKDLGENAVCPICNYEFVITGKKQHKKLIIAAIGVAVIVAAIIFGVVYSRISYNETVSLERAMENFTEVITQSFLNRGGQLTPETRDLIARAIEENYRHITEKGWQDQFVELFCDKEFAEFAADIKRKKADPNYQMSAEDIVKEKKFWAYFRYKYTYANSLLRQINLVTNKLLDETGVSRNQAE